MVSILSTAARKTGVSRRFYLAISCYFLLHICLRVVLSDSLDYDEAEQAFLGQWLLPGYTEQPPLYTWVQYLLFEIFGRNVFAVSLLKNCLLLLTYLCVFWSGRIMFKDENKAVLATVSLLLIPQIAWESQRDMTHTTLVVVAGAATLLLTLQLLEKRSLGRYLLWGALIGVGFLGKANFGLFLLVLLLALVSMARGRKVVFHPYVVIAVVTALAMNSFYLAWMSQNQDIVFSATHKFKRSVGNYYMAGPLSLVTKTFLFLTPLWLVYLLVFPGGYRGVAGNRDEPVHTVFIHRYFLAVFLVLVVVVLAFQVTYVKDRWLQPLLFAIPLVYFSRVPTGQISSARKRAFLGVTAVAACLIVAAFTLRVAGASFIDKFRRMNYPFAVIADDIRDIGFTNGLIISNNRFLAGNLLFKFTGSSAIIPGYHFEDMESIREHQDKLIVWDADKFKTIPADLYTFLQTAYQVDVQALPVKLIAREYLYGHGKAKTLAVIHIP